MRDKRNSLRFKIRELGSLLAEEEEAETRLSNWKSRKKEHDYLLKKLYQLEKKN